MKFFRLKQVTELPALAAGNLFKSVRLGPRLVAWVDEEMDCRQGP
ncbi:MAG: hypothetical protein DI594_11915 [Shewanella oneidensis]|nr:MAG: hypothetical protein DI594_11915 [Shewanella oneidensis]